MEEYTSTYNRSELYTYKEAAQIVGVSEGTIVDAARTDRLTRIKLPNDGHKYVLRVEIDAISGKGKIMTREVKAILDAIQGKDKVRDYVSEEHSYGDPVQWYSDPVHAEKAVKNNPSMFMDILENLFGGTIHLERRTTGGR